MQSYLCKSGMMNSSSKYKVKWGLCDVIFDIKNLELKNMFPWVLWTFDYIMCDYIDFREWGQLQCDHLLACPVHGAYENVPKMGFHSSWCGY